jgi:RsiW-degrading membrane proteinase PrsW (M82 family)
LDKLISERGDILIELAVTIALAPALAIGIFIYQKGRYDREPISLLLKLFIFGALIVVPVYFIERILSAIIIFPGILGAVYSSFIVAGVTEEFFKRLVTVKTVCRDKNYNEKLDGIVYTVFAALGFATVENLLYILGSLGGYGSYIYTGISRGIFAVPAHMLFAVTMGYYLSLSKFATNGEEKRRYYSKSLYTPILFHGTYDFLLMNGLSFIMPVFIIFVLYMWRVNLIKLNEYVQESRKNQFQ